MNKKFALGAGLIAAAVSSWSLPAQAQPKVYAVPSKVNYCPAGLQPITIDGVICCGTPNQTMSYNQMKAHPVARKKVHRAKTVRRVAQTYCPEGMKGCVER